jgi:chromate transporter
VQALLRIAGRALGTWLKQGVALTAFIGLCLFALPFPLVMLGAALVGAIVSHSYPEWLALQHSGAPQPARDRPWHQRAMCVSYQDQDIFIEKRLMQLNKLKIDVDRFASRTYHNVI